MKNVNFYFCRMDEGNEWKQPPSMINIKTKQNKQTKKLPELPCFQKEPVWLSELVADRT